MFVFLKLLLFLFKPLIWILLLFLYALLTKNLRRKKLAFRTTFILLAFFTNPFIINKLIAAYETQPAQLGSSQKFTTGILLGGLVSYNADEDKGYFNNASDRFIETALLYRQGRIENIIVAAGNGYLTKNNFSEAVFIKDKLVRLGVPPERIYTDGLSRNTLENAQNAKRLSDSAHVAGPFFADIVGRASAACGKKVFRKAGINPTLYPCDFLSKETRNNFFEDVLLPSSIAFNRWDNLIKEWIGAIAYSVTGKG